MAEDAAHPGGLKELVQVWQQVDQGEGCELSTPCKVSLEMKEIVVAFGMEATWSLEMPEVH